MGIIAWLRFYNHSRIAFIGATFVIVPAVIAFAVFSVWFYRNLISHKYKQSKNEMDRVENELKHLRTEEGFLSSTGDPSINGGDTSIQIV